MYTACIDPDVFDSVAQGSTGTTLDLRIAAHFLEIRIRDHVLILHLFFSPSMRQYRIFWSLIAAVLAQADIDAVIVAIQYALQQAHLYAARLSRYSENNGFSMRDEYSAGRPHYSAKREG